MYFVDDVDLVARRHWAIANTLDDLARIIHTCMACRVNFQHINMSPRTNGCAGLAGAAGFQRFRTTAIHANAVQSPGKQTRRRGFADAANPRQNKGMRETFHLQRIAQSADKRLLTNQGSKRFWSYLRARTR